MYGHIELIAMSKIKMRENRDLRSKYLFCFANIRVKYLDYCITTSTTTTTSATRLRLGLGSNVTKSSYLPPKKERKLRGNTSIAIHV